MPHVLPWIHLLLLVSTVNICDGNQLFFTSMSSPSSTDVTKEVPEGPEGPDPNNCAMQTGYVEFRLPGCGCCGGCGCNVTCRNCGDKGGMFYSGDNDSLEFGGKTWPAMSDDNDMPRPGKPGGCCDEWPGDQKPFPPAKGYGNHWRTPGQNVCTPRPGCCTGKVRVTTWFVPSNCDAKFRPGPSTKVIPVYDNFGLRRERAVIFYDGETWQVVFKDRLTGLPTKMPPPMEIAQF